MAKKSAIARLAARALGHGLLPNKVTIYKPHADFFVSGLSIEGTPYKDTVYVWRLLLPVFVDIGFKHLSYSRRISTTRSGHEDYFQGSDQEIANLITSAVIDHGIMDELSRDVTLVDFLRDHAAPDLKDLNDARNIIDTAAASLLVGDQTAWQDGLATVAAWLEEEKRVYAAAGDRLNSLHEGFGRFLALFDDSGQDPVPILRRLMQENAAKLGFRIAPFVA